LLVERVEERWIALFAEVFTACGVKPGEICAVLSETQSRPINVHLSELALGRCGAQVFHVQMVSPVQQAPVPVRSTGASNALQGIAPAVQALAGAGFVADCTVEGLLHAAELPQILKAGARVLMVSNEHPEALERLRPDPTLEAKVKAGMRRLKAGKVMHVSSDAGSDLRISLEGAAVGGGWGHSTRPGSITHWPGGLCLCFPAAGAVNGRLVLAPGDVNLTFKRYLESAVELTIEADYVTKIEGRGLDAALMRSYWESWGDREAYAVSHVGWGMNPRARWDAMVMYDKRDFNGTELRAFAGNFLYSTGANEVAGRHTLGHFDLPLRGCSLKIDAEAVLDQGKLVGELG
jgi:2,5-dihydroxypyridine 5,6-dioxygenase